MPTRIDNTAVSLCRVRRRDQLPVVWLLIVGFLLQPVLAYLVTPVLTHDVRGQQVVVCTLQGEKVVTIDLPPIVDSQEVEHCPAIKLYQMAGTVQASEPPAVPSAVLYAVELLDQTARHAHHALHFSAYATRAPPVV